MSIENIVQTVMTSKKYSNIIPETINRICNEESIKYKKDKDILRSSKKRLHIISESFLSIANANKIASIKKCIDNDGHISTEMIEQLLLLHISTKERSSFYKEFYNDIFRVVGNVNSILDIACGLNPVAYVLSDNFDSRVRYEATDINLDNIELVNKILSLYDLQAKIYGSDILCDIPNGEWDVVFLFKIVPLLEQQKKGYFRSIIEQINSKFFIITFPTKSISGKNVGMKDYYENMMTKYIENSQMEIIMGKIYVVATPIGNLSDITLRAIETLKAVDIIASEDTRRTLILLNKYNISTKLVAYHKFNEKEQATKLIELILQKDISIALVSDAGTPCISDPGSILISEALKNSIEVIPVPGVSSVIAALSVSGFIFNKK